MKLYSYWRSTTSFRVRVALNIKGLDYDIVPVDLLAGEHTADSYRAINPLQGVPTLVLDDGTQLTQSMAILDYLDRAHPTPALLPGDLKQRARVQAAAQTVAMEIHPVNNLKVLGYLKQTLGHTQDDAVDWMHHWMHQGFTAFQAMIAPDTPFCFSDTPDLADICLAGQMINARRWGLDMSPFSRLEQINDACLALDPFQRALPENQPDAS